ncbi:MAG: hypothetical protein M1836_002337 [Candelina mexicana]|nr:MAG: hypothetical protein M1836_002337 [Candelina mexicana]
MSHIEDSSPGLTSSLNSRSSEHMRTPSSASSPDDIAPQGGKGYTESMEQDSSQRDPHRSSITISATSSYHSVASSMTSVDTPSRRSSQGGRSTSSTFSRDDEPKGRTKSFFGRGGIMLRRHKPKSSLPTRAPMRLDGIEQLNHESVRRDMGTDYVKNHGHRSPTNSEIGRRRNISLPYNFHHMTHAQAKQFSEIEWTNREEIMTESTAIRVSRTPCRELQGIQAENLHFKNFSSEALAGPLSSSNSVTAPTGSMNSSPKRRSNHARRISQSSSHRPLRHMRSVESFSQPNPPKSPRAAKIGATPITPPPRKSSRAARTSRPERGLKYLDSRTAQASENIFAADGLCIAGPAPLDMSSPLAVSSGSSTSSNGTDIPHAVTTPDDTARQLSPTTFVGSIAELDCVPEEEEAQSSKRKAKRSSRSLSAPRTRRSPSSKMNTSDRHSPQSSLSSGAEIQEHHLASSQKSAVGECATLPQHKTTGRQESWGMRFADRCWEDDIDFCYEHAAEADCDFDWDRISNDGHILAQRVQPNPFTAALGIEEKRRLALERELAGKQSHKSKHSPKPLKPSAIFSGCLIPESGSRPTQSISPNDDEIITPRLRHASTISHETSFNEAEGFMLSPSLLIPTDYEPISEGIIDEKATAPYPLYDRTIEPPESGRESFRSSETTLSKSSQESIALRHKASNSGGSLPELVPSRNCREEFNHVAEQLAEQIASLNTRDIPPEIPLSTSPKLRRNRTLVKDVAHQAMLRRAASSNALNEAVALPHPSSRRPDLTRASSDNHLKPVQPPSPAVEDSIYVDKRHAESAASIASLRARNKALYSLFPTSPPTSPTRSPISPL